MKCEVRLYGDPALRRKATAVGTVDGKVRRLAKDMLKTMYDNSGVGLAAEQVGRDEALCVIDVTVSEEQAGAAHPPENPDVRMPLVMVDPKIVAASGEQTASEGCLSFPEIYIPIARSAEITVEFTDLDNRRQSVHARGLLARAVQHELDHLQCILLVDRMSAVQKIGVSGKLKRLRRSAKAAEV
ncbi:peptide deformylase [Verrucomicrobiota bacterium]